MQSNEEAEVNFSSSAFLTIKIKTLLRIFSDYVWFLSKVPAPTHTKLQNEFRVQVLFYRNAYQSKMMTIINNLNQLQFWKETICSFSTLGFTPWNADDNIISNWHIDTAFDIVILWHREIWKLYGSWRTDNEDPYGDGRAWEPFAFFAHRREPQ